MRDADVAAEEVARHIDDDEVAAARARRPHRRVEDGAVLEAACLRLVAPHREPLGGRALVGRRRPAVDDGEGLRRVEEQADVHPPGARLLIVVVVLLLLVSPPRRTLRGVPRRYRRPPRTEVDASLGEAHRKDRLDLRHVGAPPPTRAAAGGGAPPPLLRLRRRGRERRVAAATAAVSSASSGGGGIGMTLADASAAGAAALAPPPRAARAATARRRTTPPPARGASEPLKAAASERAESRDLQRAARVERRS